MYVRKLSDQHHHTVVLLCKNRQSQFAANVKTHAMKKRSETQTLRTGCSKAEPKISIAPPQIPLAGAQDGQNLISWRWSIRTFT